MRVRFNPLKADFDLVYQEPGGNSGIFARTCEPDAEIGDVVYASPLVSGKVEVNINNTVVQPSIGMIISKSTATMCQVIYLGEVPVSGVSDLGNKVFLADDGTLTQTPPLTGFMQVIGVLTSSTMMLINPNYQRVKRS